MKNLTVSPDNSRLYVTSGDVKTVTVINTTNNALVGTFTTDQTSSGGRAIYLPDDWYPLYSVAAFTRYITMDQNGTVYVTDYQATEPYYQPSPSATRPSCSHVIAVERGQPAPLPRRGRPKTSGPQG